MNKERRQFHKTRQMSAMKDEKLVYDATGCVAGRLASVVAKKLLMGATVDVVNAEKAIVSGQPDAVKERYKFKLEVGTRRKGPYFPRLPHMMLKRTVRSMMPYQLPNGRAAYKRLKCHIGVPPELKDAKPMVAGAAQRQVPMSITLGEVSRFLGGTYYEVKA
jgi:large subunit ribosomal protein L13